MNRGKTLVHRQLFNDKTMKLIKLLGVTACALALLAGPAFGADDKDAKDKAEKKLPACCEKAKAEGKECTHRCCVAAKKEGKVCEKCMKAGKKDETKKEDAK
jgi:hypothetical protein